MGWVVSGRLEAATKQGFNGVEDGWVMGDGRRKDREGRRRREWGSRTHSHSTVRQATVTPTSFFIF